MSNTIKKRRKAINCILVSDSKSSPGYFKYKVTIQEPNGDVYDLPAYGVDMQDAIKRLVSIERAEKIQKVYDKKIEPAFLVVIATAFFGAVITASLTNDYKYALYGTLGFFTSAVIWTLIRFFRTL